MEEKIRVTTINNVAGSGPGNVQDSSILRRYGVLKTARVIAVAASLAPVPAAPAASQIYSLPRSAVGNALDTRPSRALEDWEIDDRITRKRAEAVEGNRTLQVMEPSWPEKDDGRKRRYQAHVHASKVLGTLSELFFIKHSRSSKALAEGMLRESRIFLRLSNMHGEVAKRIERLQQLHNERVPRAAVARLLDGVRLVEIAIVEITNPDKSMIDEKGYPKSRTLSEEYDRQIRVCDEFRLQIEVHIREAESRAEDVAGLVARVSALRQAVPVLEQLQEILTKRAREAVTQRDADALLVRAQMIRDQHISMNEKMQLMAARATKLRQEAQLQEALARGGIEGLVRGMTQQSMPSFVTWALSGSRIEYKGQAQALPGAIQNVLLKNQNLLAHLGPGITIQQTVGAGIDGEPWVKYETKAEDPQVLASVKLLQVASLFADEAFAEVLATALLHDPEYAEFRKQVGEADIARFVFNLQAFAQEALAEIQDEG